MSTDTFSNVASIFSGKKISADQENELFKETLILSLSRMTRADLSIDAVEVDAVIKFVKTATDADISEATIRVAASSEIFESAPLDKQLQKVSKHLSSTHRRVIVEGLAEVIGSDGHVSDAEAEFFNTLVNALKLTPAEMFGFGN